MKHTYLLTLLVVCLFHRNGVCSERSAVVISEGSNPPQVASTTNPDATVRLKGVVKGPKGPLPGAIVQLSGSSTIVVSEAGGKFELDVPAASSVVEVTCSYAGFQEMVIKFPATVPLAVIELKPAARPKVEPTLESGWW